MEVGSFPKRPDREGMPIRAYRDIFTACFELNSILYYELISNEKLNDIGSQFKAFIIDPKW